MITNYTDEQFKIKCAGESRNAEVRESAFQSDLNKNYRDFMLAMGIQIYD